LQGPIGQEWRIVFDPFRLQGGTTVTQNQLAGLTGDLDGLSQMNVT
jgi:hypothetical protein